MQSICLSGTSLMGFIPFSIAFRAKDKNTCALIFSAMLGSVLFHWQNKYWKLDRLTAIALSLRICQMFLATQHKKLMLNLYITPLLLCLTLLSVDSSHPLYTLAHTSWHIGVFSLLAKALHTFYQR